jgi:hypothetical protein
MSKELKEGLLITENRIEVLSKFLKVQNKEKDNIENYYNDLRNDYKKMIFNINKWEDEIIETEDSITKLKDLIKGTEMRLNISQSGKKIIEELLNRK